MILVDGEKYACVQCIRGHRSSTCKHSQRPLVQVRSRGRPSLNQQHRIAVTESEIVRSRDQVEIASNNKPVPSPTPPLPVSSPKKSCCSQKSITTTQAKIEDTQSGISLCCSKKPEPVKQSCCSSSSTGCHCQSNSNGVILLKASKRQYVNMVDGNLDFCGPYKGSSITSFQAKGSKKPKHDKSISCGASKLKALKTLAVNEIRPTQETGSLLAVNTTHPFHNNNSNNYQFQPSAYAFSFNPPVHSISSNSFPIPKRNNFHQPLHHIPQQMQPPNGEQLHYDPSYLFKQYSEGISAQTHMFDMFQGEGCADECNCGSTCSCPGCLIHRTNEELRSYGILDSSSTTVSTPTEYKLSEALSKSNDVASPREYEKNEVNQNRREDIQEVHTPNGSIVVPPDQMINFETIDELLIQEFLEDDCSCEEDACCCYNCIKHGITNGIRLSDGIEVCKVDGAFDNGVGYHDPQNSGQDHQCGCTPQECQCFHCPEHGIYNGVRNEPTNDL